jgi:transposase-like protein
VNCKRCKVKMQPTRGTHHKQKKWTCPQCGRSRMEQVTSKRKSRGRREPKQGWDG